MSNLNEKWKVYDNCDFRDAEIGRALESGHSDSAA